MNRSVRLLFLVVFLASLGAPAASTAWAADSLDDLLDEWGIVSRRVDARGWDEQRRVLERIADLETHDARRALRRLRDLHAQGNGHRTRLILGAMFRRATPKEVDELIRWVEKEHNPILLENLAEALAEVREPEARAHLRGKALRRASPRMKAQIARSLGRTGGREGVTPLLLLLREEFACVRVEALDALSHLGDVRAVGPIMVFLEDKDASVRYAAARALGALGDVRAVTPLVRALGDANPRIVETAALSLGKLRDPAAVPALLDALEGVFETDLRVADAVAGALEEISGKAIGLDPERWRDWWAAVKDQPWKRSDPDAEPPEGRTVPAGRYYGFTIRSSRLVFVIDVSRSMGWNKRLDSAKVELMRVIEHLPGTTRFDIVTYSDEARAWQSHLERATPTFVRRAVAFVKRLRPGNGTNTWAALRLALKDEDVDTIFLLSDGQPSVGTIVNPDRILAEMRTINRDRRVRIHCVALVTGAPPTGFAGREDMRRAEDFMRRLAAENDGEFQVVK